MKASKHLKFSVVVPRTSVKISSVKKAGKNSLNITSCVDGATKSYNTSIYISPSCSSIQNKRKNDSADSPCLMAHRPIMYPPSKPVSRCTEVPDPKLWTSNDKEVEISHKQLKKHDQAMRRENFTMGNIPTSRNRTRANVSEFDDDSSYIGGDEELNLTRIFDTFMTIEPQTLSNRHDQILYTCS